MNYKNNIKKHWIIRVADGKNFKNSIHPFWGIKRGKHGSIKGFILNNINTGDILWFCTNKFNGGKAIGMAEYTILYDRNDEPLIQINTYSNKEQGWEGDDDWSLQMHYTKLYNTARTTCSASTSKNRRRSLRVSLLPNPSVPKLNNPPGTHGCIWSETIFKLSDTATNGPFLPFKSVSR